MNQQNQVFECIVCGDSISSQSSQKSLPRTKCDYCKKETDRLVNVIAYWERKVGIRIR